MKELIKDFQDNKIEIVEEEQQKKELTLLGQQRKIKGLILWEKNLKTGKIERAKYKKTNAFISGIGDGTVDSVTHTFTVVVNENCIYAQALNLKNAKKKFL